jgi:hypothetical protein
VLAGRRFEAQKHANTAGIAKRELAHIDDERTRMIVRQRMARLQVGALNHRHVEFTDEPHDRLTVDMCEINRERCHHHSPPYRRRGTSTYLTLSLRFRRKKK